MRLRLTLDALVIFDVCVLEADTDADGEPGAVHDLSTGHEVGFSAPAGWREPMEAADTARRGVPR